MARGLRRLALLGLAGLPAAVADVTCVGKASDQATYTGPSGAVYQIQCGIDYTGSDLSSTSTTTFAGCIDTCDATPGCIDVSYAGEACYLKNKIETPLERDWVWTAKQVSPAAGAPAKLSCVDKKSDQATYTSSTGASFQVQCGVDYAGGDMGATNTATFEACIDACAALVSTWEALTESDGSEVGAVTVRLNITYSYPSLVLDHSIYIKDVVCEAGTLHGRFNTSYPFYFAQDTWETDEDVILITSAATCGTEAAQNAFFLAHTISFQESTLSFEALGQLVELKDVFADLTVDFGNITVTGSSEEEQEGSTCGSPSGDTLRGLPAVVCGTNFDKSLDDKLGYYSAGGRDAQAVLELAAPMKDNTPIQARDFWGDVWDGAKSVGKAAVNIVVDTGKAIGNAIGNGISAAVGFAVNTAKAIAKATVALAVHAVKLVGFVVTGKYENSLTLPVNVGPPASAQVDSPWGKAFKMYTFRMGKDNEKFSATQTLLENLAEDLIGEQQPEPGVEIYCVNCGARGSVKASGKINATPLSGVKEASIGISGSMYIGMYLGINGFAQWEKEWEKELFSKGLPGWSIPGIVTLGPKISLSGKFTLGVEAEGQVLTGASLTWTDFQATLDLKNPRNSNQNGWTPMIDHVFQVHGGVKATAALGLPVSLWFGIDILNGAFKEGIALVDTPAVTGEAEYQVDVGTDQTSIGTDECVGVAWDIKLTNEVTLEVDNGPEWKITEWASPSLAEGCIGYTPNDGSGGSGSNNGTSGGNPPVIPGLPGGDDGIIVCPKYDKQTYTDDKGNQWQVRCNYDYMYFDTAQVWADTMNECMDWCATQANCAGVSCGTAGAQGHWNCWGRSRAGPARAGPYHSLMLMSPFEIISVVFGTVDITNYAIQNWQVGNRIEINTNTVSQSITSAQDRLPGTQKSIFMLYRYGAETRSWVGKQNTGTLTIRPGPVGVGSMLTTGWAPPTKVAGKWPMPPFIQIIEVCYGAAQNRDRLAWNTLYLNAFSSAVTLATNTLFGDNWYGVKKSVVIWYKDIRGGQDGPMYIVTGVENDGLKLMSPAGVFKRDLLTLPPRQESPGPYSNSTAPSNATVPAATESEPGTGIATVRDSTGSLQLYSAINGNLFLAAVDSADDLSVLTNGAVLNALTLPGNTDVPYLVNSDSSERLLHYFPDEVSSLGASRLRLASWDKLPVGSRLVNLAPVAPTSGPVIEPVLVAIDPAGDYLFPVMCAIENQLNKVFLVKDVSDAALAALEAEDLKFVLTGGQASQCGPLALTATVVETST